MIQITGSRIHTPRYPSNGVINTAATNLATSSIILADNGTIFLPTPCRLLLKTNKILSTKKKGY